MTNTPALTYTDYSAAWHFEQDGPWPNEWPSVHQVTASLRRGRFGVWIEGLPLRRDGERSQQRRGVSVDLDRRDLPKWLTEIIADARARLAVKP